MFRRGRGAVPSAEVAARRAQLHEIGGRSAYPSHAGGRTRTCDTRIMMRAKGADPACLSGFRALSVALSYASSREFDARLDARLA